MGLDSTWRASSSNSNVRTRLNSASHSTCCIGNMSTRIIRPIDAVCFARFKFNGVHFCRLIVAFLCALS